MEKFKQLRDKYRTMVYDGFTTNEDDKSIHIKYKFILSDIIFEPQISIIKKNNFITDLTDETLKILFFNFGMIELLSYYKCACPPKIIVKCGFLDNEQIKFWKELYYKGLGEFRYINGIDVGIEELVEFEVNKSIVYNREEYNLKETNLIPIGGGKDSAVTVELLSQFSNNMCLILNPKGAALRTAFMAGYDKENIFEVFRTIDPKLLELNRQGFLNGHTPFSAMLAFLSLICSAFCGAKYIVLSNEDSANEATVSGSDINHQYSKTFEFEYNFNQYVKKYISDDFKYFSLLRPISELQIAKLFCNNEKYFKIFKSCNVGSREDIWCGKCPKCLFVFIMLSAFIEPNKISEIFGYNLLDNEELLNYFEELVGYKDVKPFECVGTRGEVNTALTIALSKYTKLPYLLEHYKNKLSKFIVSEEEIIKYQNYYNDINLLPEDYEEILRNALFER